MAIAFVWVFGVGLQAAHMIPTGKVGLIDKLFMESNTSRTSNESENESENFL